MTWNVDDSLARARADRDSDWPTRLLDRVAKAPLVDEASISKIVVGGTGAEPSEMTDAVRRVLQAASFGLTNQMIADTYGLSVETVKTQMRQGLLAVGAKNRTQACCLALRQGLIV